MRQNARSGSLDGMDTTLLERPTPATDDEQRAVDALDTMLAADVACAEPDDLAALVRCVRTLRGFVDAYDVEIARRGRALTERDRPRPAPMPDAAPPRPGGGHGRDEADLIGMLLSSGAPSGKDAKAASARESACAALPAFQAALAAGEISGAHVDVLARWLRGITDAEICELRARQSELLNHARREFAEGFDKMLRAIVSEIRNRHRPNSDADELDQQRRNSKVSSWVDRDSGMHKTLIELDPIRHQEFTLAVDAQLARLKADPASARTSIQELKVEAFMAALSGQHDGTPRVPKTIVVVDLTTLTDGPHDRTVAELSNGTPVPVSTIRDLVGGSDIVPVLLSGEGQPLRVGRTRRVATAAQRDALTAIYRTCPGPGCTCPVDQTQAHHVTPWRQGGTTDIEQLLPLCPTHHDAIHHGGHRVEVTGNHTTLTWYLPDGTIAHRGGAGNRRPPPTGPPAV